MLAVEEMEMDVVIVLKLNYFNNSLYLGYIFYLKYFVFTTISFSLENVNYCWGSDGG